MKIYNLFISHSWDYSDNYDNLINLLRRKSYFDFKDYSVPRDDPIHTSGTDWQLEQSIEVQMRLCSAVLVLAGVYATYSKWIDKEIQIAKNFEKSIIAIEFWEAKKPPSLSNKMPIESLDGIQTALLMQ